MVFTDVKTKKILSDTQRPKFRGTNQSSFYFTHYSMFDRVKTRQDCKSCGGK